MKHTLSLLSSILLAPLAVFSAAEFRDRFSPHQRVILEAKSPPPVDTRFSFDAPAGPQFTDAEKEVQRKRGKEVIPMVMKAFEGGAGEVRIPPGDYRFGQERYEGAKVIYPLGFYNMQRDAEHPFVIDATGATFWFDLSDEQMPPGHRCVGFRNCRNIVLRGATIDRGTRGCIEGRITRIDRAGNRFEIQPSPDVVVPATYKGGEEQRLFPFKSDGRFCAPLYDLQPGIRKLRYKAITPSSDGRYWINMHDLDLMERIHDANWQRAYGELGVVSVGDGLSCLYTTAGAIVLEDSANLTLYGVSVYVAKGGPSESGGDGAHLWKDCTFGPRPGTSQWKGADGYLFRSTRYGATLDNVTIRHTADDLANFHGIWGKVKSVSGQQLILETNAALRPTLDNARPGDRLYFIHRKTGVFLGEAKVTALNGFQLTLDRDATLFAEAQAEWLDHECAGWTVQHCRWEDNFQRLLIMSGPGTVRDCTFIRMGSNISLNTGMGLVGGIPNDITISNNTFIDVNARPQGVVIDARAHNAQGQDAIPPIERLMIVSNTFVRSGGPSISLIGVKSARITGNRFDSPVRATLLARPNESAGRQAILLRHSSSIEVNSNNLIDSGNCLLSDKTSGSPLLGLDDCREITLDARRIEAVPSQDKPTNQKQSALAKPVESDKRLHSDGKGWGLDQAKIVDASRPRVLLIGDSILSGYMKSVTKQLEGKVYVDAWVNPYCQSEHYNKLLAEVLAKGPYDVVHVNMGLHGWPKGRIKEGTFEPLTKAYMEVIRERMPKAKIVWASSTPVTVKGKPTELDPEINTTMIEHNRMAAKVMEELKIPMNDFYGLLVNKLALARGDQFHWKSEAYAILAQCAIDSLLRELGLPPQPKEEKGAAPKK